MLSSGKTDSSCHTNFNFDLLADFSLRFIIDLGAGSVLTDHHTSFQVTIENESFHSYPAGLISDEIDLMRGV